MKILSYLAFVPGFCGPTLAVSFDANTQRIDVGGDHEFQPPGPHDFRGPCPGLNALANHGFIPRNGIACFDELINASVSVFGLGIDQATALSIYGTAFSVSPDVTHLSIGAALESVFLPPYAVSLKVPPQGLNFPHTSFEVDASPSRFDKYQNESGGNMYDASGLLLEQLFDLQKDLPEDQVNFDLGVLADHRNQRHIDSIAKNPMYFLQPFGGLYLNGNKYNFIYRLFADHTADYPEGRLDRDTLMSFYGAQRGPIGGTIKYYKGWERIPDLWHRRPLDDPYDLRKSNDDLLYQAKRHPDLIDKYGLGGNVAGINTHRTIDIDQLTNGTYSLETIRDGYNLSCLGFLSAAHLAPNWLKGYYEDYQGTVVAKLLSRLPPLIESLNCTLLPGPIDERFFSMFAGYNASLPNTSL